MAVDRRNFQELGSDGGVTAGGNALRCAQPQGTWIDDTEFETVCDDVTVAVASEFALQR